MLLDRSSQGVNPLALKDVILFRLRSLYAEFRFPIPCHKRFPPRCGSVTGPSISAFTRGVSRSRGPGFPWPAAKTAYRMHAWVCPSRGVSARP